MREGFPMIGQRRMRGFTMMTVIEAVARLLFPNMTRAAEDMAASARRVSIAANLELVRRVRADAAPSEVASAEGVRLDGSFGHQRPPAAGARLGAGTLRQVVVAAGAPTEAEVPLVHADGVHVGGLAILRRRLGF
jgi:hypothetical protein